LSLCKGRLLWLLEQHLACGLMGLQNTRKVQVIHSDTEQAIYS